MKRFWLAALLLCAVIMLAQLPKPGTGGSGSSAASNITLVALGSGTSTSGAVNQTVASGIAVGTYRFTGSLTTLGLPDDECTVEARLFYLQSGTVSALLSDLGTQMDIGYDNRGHPWRAAVFTTSDVSDVVLTIENGTAPCATWDFRYDYMLERITAP